MSAPVWLIEWPANRQMPVRYWHPTQGHVIDPNHAVRFARQQDAEAMMKRDHLFGGASPVEHIFDLSPLRPTQEGSHTANSRRVKGDSPSHINSPTQGAESLKACPFCGGDAVVGAWSRALAGHYIDCKSCHVRLLDQDGTEETAARAWNRRPTPTEGELDPKRLLEKMTARAHELAYDSLCSLFEDTDEKLEDEIDKLLWDAIEGTFEEHLPEHVVEALSRTPGSMEGVTLAHELWAMVRPCLHPMVDAYDLRKRMVEMAVKARPLAQPRPASTLRKPGTGYKLSDEVRTDIEATRRASLPHAAEAGKTVLRSAFTLPGDGEPWKAAQARPGEGLTLWAVMKEPRAAISSLWIGGELISLPSDAIETARSLAAPSKASPPPGVVAEIERRLKTFMDGVLLLVADLPDEVVEAHAARIEAISSAADDLSSEALAALAPAPESV